MHSIFMAHSHNHHHHTHKVDRQSLNSAFIIGIALNVGFVIIEALFGFIYDSMGLLSDAGHNLSDVFALLLSLVAFKLMDKSPDERHTYGYRKFSIQASLLNALLLYVAVGMILVESIDKLLHPVAVNGEAVAWIAGAGVIVNGLTAWLFLKDKEKDINVKGAYLHMMADTLVSIGVVAAGIIIHFTDWYFIDPIIGICIAILIGWSTWSLLAESFRLSIDSVPRGINIHDLEKEFMKIEGVLNVHHIHVWPLSTTENAMTVHAVISSPDMLNIIIGELKKIAKHSGIDHSTIEVETASTACQDACLISPD